MRQTASQIEHQKGNKNREWLQKTGELVGEGEWINKTVLSASLEAAGSIKWVDVGRWVSPFSPCSSPFFSFRPFLLLSFSSFHMADSPFTPPPALLHTLLKWHLSCTQTHACLHKHPTSPEPCLIYGSITADRPPGRTSSAASSCPDVFK